MAYILPNDVTDAPLSSLAKDLALAVRIIEDRWKQFPLLPYRTLQAYTKPNVSGTLDAVQVTGNGFTNIDLLYNEPVDGALTQFQQPHTTAGVSADLPSITVYADPVMLNTRVHKNLKNLDVKEFGWEKFFDLVFTVPLSLLDRNNITVQVGDLIKWDNAEYEVVQFVPAGYLRNTNVCLYMHFNCRNRRVGS